MQLEQQAQSQSSNFNLKKWNKAISGSSALLIIAAAIIRLISGTLNIQKIILSVHFM